MSETSRDEGADDLVILDGGLGHLLKAQGVEQLCKGLRFDELFAAGCLANSRRPDIVQRAHEHFIHAGADVITTNSFACTRWSLGKIGRESDALSLAMASAEIARKAASNAEHLVRIAGGFSQTVQCALNKGPVLRSRVFLISEGMLVVQVLCHP